MGFLGQEYWRDCHVLLQRIFPTQGSNLCLLNCSWVLSNIKQKVQKKIFLIKKKKTYLVDWSQYRFPGPSPRFRLTTSGLGEECAHLARSQLTSMWLVCGPQFENRCSILHSDQISRSVVSDSLRPHESQHTRPPCPSPTPRVHPDTSIESDAIQPSHPLSSPSPPAPNPSQHQSLFQWVNSSHEVAKVLEFQL